MNWHNYIDIHTHSLVHDPEVTEVMVLDSRTSHLFTPPPTEYFCYGLHPWFAAEVEMDVVRSFFKLLVQHPGFFAFGEIGLDRVCKVDWQKKLEILRAQIDLINQWKVPRVIIHSVKAYSDLIPELKSLKFGPKILFHDFNASLETSEQLMKHFDCYFSFGAKLFNETTKASSLISSLPPERIFLETDDQAKYSIFQIYQQAASLLNMELEDLKKLLWNNFERYLGTFGSFK